MLHAFVLGYCKMWSFANTGVCVQVESLQAQLAEQTKLAKEQLDALLEDRRVKEEEFETRRRRDEEKIRILTEKWVLKTSAC